MVALFVALMFITLVLADLGVEKWRAWHVAKQALAARTAREAVANGFDPLFHLPQGVHLAPQHTWVKSDPAGGLEVGADALLVRAVGGVRHIVLPKVGEQVTAGQPLFLLEHNNRTLTIPSAITGRVMAVNERLAREPELLSADPYEAGWVCYLSPTHADQMAPSVRFGEQASIWLEGEFARLREFMFSQLSPDMALGSTSQDGGIPAPGCLVELGPDAWKGFEANFLSHS